MTAVQRLSASQLHMLEVLGGATFVKTCEIGRCAKHDDSELSAEVLACVTSLLDKLWAVLDAVGLKMRLASKAERAAKDLYSARFVYEIHASESKVAEVHVKVRANRINDAIKVVAKVAKVIIEQAAQTAADQASVSQP